ncbi:MAG: ABC transporter ATP-binding protein [Alkalispirochaeta sp.]
MPDTNAILEIRDLHRDFGGERRFLAGRTPVIHAVNGVDITLERGDSLGVVGESGCGKSTLARMIMGIIPPTGGSIAYRGRDITSLTAQERRELYRNIQFVFQDPTSSLNPRKTVREILEAPMKKLLDLDQTARTRRLSELMERVNMREEFLDRHPHEFSGGQAQRIGIARALAVQPEMLILDEPVSALDVSIQAQIIDLLKALKRDLDLTYLFISHDLAVVDYLCDRVAVMYLGEVVEEGTAAQIFEHPRHPYTHVLLDSVPDPEKQAADRQKLSGELPDPSNLPPGCPFAPRCYRVQPECRTTHPELVTYGESGHRAACFYGDDPRTPEEYVR